MGILPSAAHASFGCCWAEHLVSLHHAAVGEVAVVFIRIASPREVGRSASATVGSPLYLIITDLSGRTVYLARFTGAPLPLDRFAPGVYIATLGPSRLKIALR